jgi:hypothetical protein
MSETAELMANRWWRQGDGDFLESIAETILAIEARLAALEAANTSCRIAMTGVSVGGGGCGSAPTPEFVSFGVGGGGPTMMPTTTDGAVRPAVVRVGVGGGHDQEPKAVAHGGPFPSAVGESSRPVQSASETAAAGAGDTERESKPAASDGPGDGYRWVREGEVILASDEGEREVGVWGRVRHVMGLVCDEPCTYRRRIRPTVMEMRHALGVSRQDVARLTAERDAAHAERDAAIRERDEFKESWLSAADHATRLVSRRDAALAEVERHRMTQQERMILSSTPGTWTEMDWSRFLNAMMGYLDRTKEGE